MSELVKVYCVDDVNASPLIDLEVLGEEGYDVQLLASGRTCFEMSQAALPDLVLIDTLTPELDGFETCRKIRECALLTHVPIIFISSDSSIESRLHSYAVGGDDYVIKPFESSELKAKVKAAIKRKNALDQVKKEVSDVTLSTMDIMRSMGEMSVVVHFLQGICNCSDYESLANKIIKAHQDLGLDVAIQITVKDEKMQFFTDGVENPMEDSVFEFVRSKGRLIDFGQRTAVNFPYVSIIVRNMPADNTDFHGRIRDHVAVIGQGADSKVRGLITEVALREQSGDLLRMLEEIDLTVTRIDAANKERYKQSAILLSKVGDSLDESFMRLGLSPEQEEYLHGVIEESAGEINALFKSGLSMDKEFEAILSQISETLNTNDIKCVVDEPKEESADDATVTLF